MDRNSKIGIVYTDFALFGEKSKVRYSTFPLEWQGEIKRKYFYIIHFPDFAPNKIEEFKKRNFMHGSSLFRKQSFENVGGYEEKKNIPEDHFFFYKIIQKGWDAYHVSLPLLEYRQHSNFQANIQFQRKTRFERTV